MAGLKKEIIQEILGRGNLYEVGGSVRDEMLFGNKEVEEKDYLVTKIPLEELSRLLSKFGKVDLVGKSFGVIKFTPLGAKFSDGRPAIYDVALPRREFSTGVGHKDFSVQFDHNLPVEEDLKRRDFTINAIAKEVSSGKIIDPLNGKADLKKRVIRMVSEKAFAEDPLRMLRGIGFAARLEFQIEENTFEGIKKNASLIKTVAAERIGDELNKLLLKASKPGSGFKIMQQTGILKLILPELEVGVGVDQPGGFHKFDVFEHTLITVDNCPFDLVIRLAALFHDICKPQTRKLEGEGATFYGHEKMGAQVAQTILERLRYSNDIIADVVLLVNKHMFTTQVTDKGLRRLIRQLGEKNIFKLLDLRRADIVAQGRGGSYSDVDEFEKKIKEELERKPPFSLKDLAINGNDIMSKFSLSPGPIIGKVLNHLLEKVLDDPSYNQKDLLLKEASEFLKKEAQTHSE